MTYMKLKQKRHIHISYPFQFRTQTLIFVGVILSVLIPSIVTNIFYLNLQNAETVRQFNSYNQSVIEQSGEKLDILLKQINMTSRQLIAGAVSSENLKNPRKLSAQERVNAYNRFSKLLMDMEMSLTFHAGIYLVGDTLSFQSANNVLDLDSAVRDLADARNGVPYVAYHYNSKASQKVIPFITEIKNYSNVLVNKIVIELFYSDLEEALKDTYLGDESELFLIISRGILLYYAGINSDKWLPLVGSRLEGQPESSIKDRTIYTYTTEQEDWKLLAYTDIGSAVGRKNALSGQFNLNLLICVVLAFLFSLIVSRSVKRPMNELINKMSHIDDDTIASEKIETVNRDIQELSSTFDLMRLRISKLVESVAAKEKENSSIQLKMLQAQINPHFLYNTLEVMRSIALEHHVDSIEEISRYLAKMFRYSISNRSSIVRVSDEIEHVKSYINIQKYRFGDRLQVVYAVDSGILDLPMTKFILQPIVENAILHGLDQAERQGVITIIAGMENDFIQFRIIDNGAGISRQKLDELREDLRNHNESSSGIGVANVDARLRLYYGVNYGLNIESEEGTGTQVTIRIPVEGD